MKKVTISTNNVLILDDDGTYYLRETNSYTGGVNVFEGQKEGDFIVFKTGSRQYWSIRKAKLDIYFV